MKRIIILILSINGLTFNAFGISISFENNNAVLTWNSQLGSSSYVIEASEDPYDFTSSTEIEVIDTFYVYPIALTNTFFRVRPVMDFISINALHKTRVFEFQTQRAYIDSEHVTLEKSNDDAYSFKRIIGDRESL